MPVKIGHVGTQNLTTFFKCSYAIYGALVNYAMATQFSALIKHLVDCIIQVTECRYSIPVTEIYPIM